MVKKKIKKARSVIEVLREDDMYVRLRKALREGQYSVNTDEMLNELETLHASRGIRKYKYGEFMASAQKKLIDAAMQDQAHRSRAAELQMKCIRLSSQLTDVITALRDHFSVTYSEELSSHKTVKERDSVLNKVLDRGVQMVNQLNRVVSVADYLVEDIDKASFALKHVIEVLKITHTPERSI